MSTLTEPRKFFALYAYQDRRAVQFNSVQFNNLYSGLSDKHHYKDHYSVKCTVR